MNQGIRKSAIKRLENLVGSVPEEGGLLSPELLAELAELTDQTGVEIIVSQDASGRILNASFGTSDRAEAVVPKEQERTAGVRNFNILHTHPNGNPTLSEADLSTAAAQRPALIAAIGTDQGRITGYGAALPAVGENGLEYLEVYGNSLEWFNALPVRKNRSDVNSKLKAASVHDEEHETGPERAILAGIDTGDSVVRFDASMKELERLAETAGAETVGLITQNRERPESGTYLGRGKLEELALAVQNEAADVVITNDALDPAQISALENAGGVKVIDRTQLILDIFADHARSAEGRIQVELAQQKYRLSRLRGLGLVLSRTGGGIGTRGPGEKKLETDRRRINRQIWELERRFEKISKNFEVSTNRRKRSGEKTVALAGYTNAGKSTLFNLVTGSDVVEKDGLFVTLDSTVRQAGEHGFLLSDTVGFIDKLPHELVKAFRTTLSEAREADILLHVIDASDPDRREHEEVVLQVLREIGCLGETGQKLITVYNKADLLDQEQRVLLENKIEREGGVLICAKTGEGVDRLLGRVGEELSGKELDVTFLLPYEKGGLVSELYKIGKDVQTDYLDSGTSLRMKIREDEIPGEARPFIQNGSEKDGEADGEHDV